MLKLSNVFLKDFLFNIFAETIYQSVVLNTFLSISLYKNCILICGLKDFLVNITVNDYVCNREG